MARSLLTRTLLRPLSFARQASKALLNLPKSDLLYLEDRSRALEERFGSLKAVFARKQYRQADDMFFRFESLPPLGKEYWFMLFSSTQKDSKQQLIVTAGRGVGGYTVNHARADSLGARFSAFSSLNALKNLTAPVSPTEKKAAAVVWAYDTKKRVYIDGPSVTRANNASKGKANSLAIEGKNSRVELTGAYPRYKLTVRQAGKTVASLSLRKPKKGKAVEIADMFRVPGLPGLGIGIVNLYFDFSGTLHGKPFTGACYVQKVVCVTPFAPWNWVRVRFRDGSTLEFFVPRVELGELKIPLERWARVTDAKTGRTAEFSNFKLQQIGKGATRRLVLSNKAGTLFCEMSAYAVQPFRFAALGTFAYDEYLVQVRDFRAKTPGGWRSMDDLKGGVGIFEDATGYLL
jgi:hypothetical protein